MKFFKYIKTSLQRIGVIRSEVPITPETDTPNTEINEETQPAVILSQLSFQHNVEDSDYSYGSSDVNEKVSAISAVSSVEKIVNEEDTKTSIESSAEEQVKESAELSETTDLTAFAESAEADISNLPSTSAQALQVLYRAAEPADQLGDQERESPNGKPMKRKLIDEVCPSLAKRKSNEI